jgi:hypothetical protein
MKLTTLQVLRDAYAKLQDLIEELYTAALIALDNDEFLDASVLQIRADSIQRLW